jgi:exosortase E/protease (VPEID-CTERM system)
LSNTNSIRLGEVSPGLGALSRRLLVLVLILGSEGLLASVVLDNGSLSQTAGVLPGLVRSWGPWGVRCVIAFCALFATFAYLKCKPALASVSAQVALAPLHRTLLLAHFPAIMAFGILSVALYDGGFGRLSGNLAASLWMIAGLAAVAFLGLALLPWALWVKLVYSTGKLWIYASTASLIACVLGNPSRALWEPLSKLTFALVKLFLSPIVPDMILQPAAMRIGTHRFTAVISPECSGLEGVGLVLIFGVLWLMLFREESRFPQSLVLLPAAVLVLFLLNAARIGVLILIGDAGARDIAAGGFHSQAGWMAFNSVAFGFSIAARRLSWFSVTPPRQEPPAAIADTATPAYLVPFLAILAAGMISRAASGSFEWLYSLRFFVALGALWVFRRRYATVDWKFSWLAPAAGAAVFVLWIGFDLLTGSTPAGGAMPSALASVSPAIQIPWIMLRIMGAVITVPIAEELAFRGFLLRRLISADFEAVSLQSFTWLSLLLSSLIFGLMHGERWLAGAAAGLVYALAARHRGRLGDAVAAHATTNALLAWYVLFSQKWSLW